MKMLFFSADLTEVQQASSEFAHAGIACEVRNSPNPRSKKHPSTPCAELWIRDERDCHRALMLCVQLGIGFSRRPPQKATVLEIDDEPAEVMEMD